MPILCDHKGFKHATVGIRGGVYLTAGSRRRAPNSHVVAEWFQTQSAHLIEKGFTPVLRFWTDSNGDKHEDVILDAVRDA